MAAPIDKIFGNLAVLRENPPFHPDQRGNVKDGTQWVLGKIGYELGIMFTGGSTSVKDAWQPMREAGAVARAMRARAAAQEWQSPVGELRTEDGFVIHRDGRRASCGSLATRAATRPRKPMAPRCSASTPVRPACCTRRCGCRP